MDDLIERDMTIHELEAFRDSCIANLLRMSFEDIIDVVKDIPAVNRWIPCSERLPEIDKDVLVYAVRKDGLGDAVTTITQYINHIWFGHRIDTEPYWRDPWQYFHSGYEITHWMPLPEPPEKE